MTIEQYEALSKMMIKARHIYDRICKLRWERDNLLDTIVNCSTSNEAIAKERRYNTVVKRIEKCKKDLSLIDPMIVMMDTFVPQKDK